MPGVTKLPRYVVQKGTAATLDFAAVAAQASRILKPFEKQLPGLADSCLKAAVKAWEWATKYPSVIYSQRSINEKYDPDISTGEYGDRKFTDECIGQWQGYIRKRKYDQHDCKYRCLLSNSPEF